MKRWLTAYFCALAAVLRVGGLAISEVPVPLDGFFPLVGIGLTDEFIVDDLLGQNPVAEQGVQGNLLGAGGTPFYDVGLLDTGAGLSLVTDAAFTNFGLGESGQGGGSDGYRGTETVPIGGATGVLNAAINDPLGLYTSGLQDRTGAGATLTMDNSALQGQTNTSMLTFPADSDLPNVIGLPYASQYTTSIRNDLPQVFELDGRTVRSPSIEFLPLGSGGGDISRKAALSLDPGAAFTTAPGYFQNILNIVNDLPVHENPQLPTGMGGGIASGGLFVDAYASNNGTDFGSPSAPIGFFFDTGASVTVMSEATAATLGFDVVTDTPDFTISLLGSGGEIADVPGFYLDELTVPALGGALTATNVPVVVLDVTDVSDPGNIVPGILGTNLFAGRNLVIDPVPSIGAGGESAGLYISDPVTSDFDWAATEASAVWSAGDSWDTQQTTDLLSATRLTPVGEADQQAVVTAGQNVEAWTTTIEGGAGGSEMTAVIENGASLTTFSGSTIGQGGTVTLQGGRFDTQYIDVRGGRIEGAGEIRTGSGPIDGQVEVVAGQIAPNGRLELDGRLILGSEAELEFRLFGIGEESQLVVEGTTTFDGGLSVELEHVPTLGDQFDLVTHSGSGGEFDAVALPELYEWEIDYADDTLTLSVVGLAGDFNEDGRVDAADYSVWVEGLGTTYEAEDYAMWSASYGAVLPRVSGDFNLDGQVDAIDYLVWQEGFGTRFTEYDRAIWIESYGSSLGGNVASIPEPTSRLLSILVITCAAALRCGLSRR